MRHTMADFDHTAPKTVTLPFSGRTANCLCEKSADGYTKSDLTIHDAVSNLCLLQSIQMTQCTAAMVAFSQTTATTTCCSSRLHNINSESEGGCADCYLSWAKLRRRWDATNIPNHLQHLHLRLSRRKSSASGVCLDNDLAVSLSHSSSAQTKAATQTTCQHPCGVQARVTMKHNDAQQMI